MHWNQLVADLTVFACPVSSRLTQDGTSERDVFFGGAMGPDGSVVLAGKRQCESLSEARVVFSYINPEASLFVNCMTTASFHRRTIFPALTKTRLCAGETAGDWNGTNSGDDDDLAAVKLDAEGNELWRYQVR